MFRKKERDKNRKLYATPRKKLHAGWWVLLVCCALYGIIPMGLLLAENRTEDILKVLIILAPLYLLVIVLMIRERIWIVGGYQRFYEYTGVLGCNTICSISELAKKVGKKPDFVIKDLKSMINRKWFLEGVLDKETQYLVTDLDTWDAFKNIRDKLIRIKEQQTAESARNQDPRVLELLARSDDFIGQLLDFWVANRNAQIIPHVEQMIERIFQIRQNAMEHPEKGMNLKSLLERYLPTVIRLLEAYEIMYKQTASDTDARNTVRRINDIMGELNLALERLLKEEMQKKVEDVSADLRVLEHTMRWDGLTEDELMRMIQKAKK